MEASGFDDLLTGDLSTELTWEASSRCPCLDADGRSDPTCVICGGDGTYYAEHSLGFQAGVVSVTARMLEKIQQRFGPGAVGDATVSLPSNAPCYEAIKSDDRFLLPNNFDNLEWTLIPGVLIKLPLGAEIITAKARSTDKTEIVTVPAPEPDANGRVSTTYPLVMSMLVPRRLQVVTDISQLRSWAEGLPKRILVKLVDWSVR